MPINKQEHSPVPVQLGFEGIITKMRLNADAAQFEHAEELIEKHFGDQNTIDFFTTIFNTPELRAVALGEEWIERLCAGLSRYQTEADRDKLIESRAECRYIIQNPFSEKTVEAIIELLEGTYDHHKWYVPYGSFFPGG